MRTPLLLAAALLALPASAAAAPPPNDNYLASTTIAGTAYLDSVDTTEATTQADLFDPSRDGLPTSGGGGAEPAACGAGGAYGRTAWWDFEPPSDGRLQLRADAGFDVVVAVYTWSERSSRIIRRVACRNDGAGSEAVLLPRVRAGTDYTVQVGGANGAGGPLSFSLDYHPDTDGDGLLDGPRDRCRTQAGPERLRGCPPELRAAPRISYTVTGTSLRITSVAIEGVPRGARAEVRCRRCGGRRVTRRATRGGTLRLPRFAGRVLPAGDRLELRVTLGRTGSGRYRFGAVGRYYRWPIEPGELGRRTTRCIRPGTRKLTRCR
jgi:hypothetical protein